MWYDPSDLSTMFQDINGTVPVTAADQPVARIHDKSGRGNHAMIEPTASVSKRPMLRNAGALWWLDFDGADDGLRAVFTCPQPIERISSIRQETWTNGDIIFQGVGSGVACALYQTGTSPNLALYSGSAQACNNAGAALATTVVTTERHSGAGSRLAINNGAYSTGNPGTLGAGGISIGMNEVASGGYSDMLFYGTIMINRLLTDTEIANARTWMASKGGVTL